jgi:hypothetical protein
LGTQGNLAFNVVTGGAFNYSATSQYQSTESIRNSAGTSLLSISCVNPLLDCLGGPSFSGTLNLAPGAYILAFTDTAYQLVGTTQDSNMSFSLQSVAVPLPATAWLLLSGLITVFGTAAVGGRRFSLESVSDVEATGAYLT